MHDFAYDTIWPPTQTDPSQEARRGVTGVPALDALQLYRKALQWLLGALCEPLDGPTVVCTHHAPHRRSVATQFEGDLLSAAFVSHLPELVEGLNAPDLWIHGHTHAALDYRVGSCRVVCNPLGYPHERTGVDTALIIEV